MGHADMSNGGSIMSVEPLQQAIRSTRAVLSGVDRHDLGAATPCASWTVSDLVNHIVGGQFFFAAVLNGETPSGERKDFAAGDFVAAFDQGSAASVAAFAAEGAMERTVHLPFGDLPGSMFVGIAATDTFIHGWDLAKATDQPSDLEPDLAAALLSTVGPFLPDSMRGPDGEALFGPKQEAPDGASNADQLAAFLGRTP
jgi:uncharacterized protein (TIGR03086 family)